METKAAIYSRKSRFTGKGESIENQIELCKQYISMNYGKKAADKAQIFEDEGFSGKNLERPQFKQMMKAAEKKLFNVIVVYRLDRISRNIGDFANLIERLHQLDIDFVSIKEQFDTSSPMGRAMMYISSVFSQLERETIAERIRDNMQELSKTGRWLGGITPTGYCSESVSSVNIDGKTKKACKLKAIPEELEIVRQIFKTFIESDSLTKTDTYLLNHGYFTKNNKRFTRFAIRAILTNPVYMIADEDAYEYFLENNANIFSGMSRFDGIHGMMAYNRTLQTSGKTTKHRPIEEWVVSVGEHEGIIDGKTWIRVQEMLERNSSKQYRKARSHVALLSGLLICGNCGEFMRPKMTNRINSQGENVYTYKCSMKERSHGNICNIRDCSGNLLDKMVIDQIRELGEDGSYFLKTLEKSRKSVFEDSRDSEKELAELKKNLSANEGEIRKLVLTLGKVAGTPAEDYIVEQINDLHRMNVSLKSRIDELHDSTAVGGMSEIEFDLLADTLKKFKDTVDDMTVEEKRGAVRALVKKIVWDGNDIHLLLFGSEPTVPPGPDGSGPSRGHEEPEGQADPKGNTSKTDENGDDPADGKGWKKSPSGEDSK